MGFLTNGWLQAPAHSVVHPALLDNSINWQQQADVCTGKDAVIQRYDGQINDVQ